MALRSSHSIHQGNPAWQCSMVCCHVLSLCTVASSNTCSSAISLWQKARLACWSLSSETVCMCHCGHACLIDLVNNAVKSWELYPLLPWYLSTGCRWPSQA